MTKEFIDFVNAHRDEDTAQLLLSAARYPSIDMPAVVRQIEGRRMAREKWPSLLECDDFMYPPKLNREQSSSEATARYKTAIISNFHFDSLHLINSQRCCLIKLGRRTTQPSAQISTVADLTGGMGVDTIAMARVCSHVDYVERDENLCRLMEHNLRALGIANVAVHNADSMEWLEQTPSKSYDLIFVDPARRSAAGRKVAAFDDCSPNIIDHAEMLRSHSRYLMVKASPMIDIDLACRQLGDVGEVHIVGVKGECKEVLFVCGEPQGEPQIVCRDFKDPVDLNDLNFSFLRSEEAAQEGCYCVSIEHYLYEPCAAIMKGGPFKLVAQRLGLAQLGPNTHLYTSNTLVDDFPGRKFEVLQPLKLSRKEIARVVAEGKAHVLARNYPVAAADLQRQLGLKEGGELFVVATTLGRDRCGFLCRRI